jgi:DNA-binding CsgD family transcriptional regulator
MSALSPKRKRDEAAALVAAGELEDEQIAAKLGIARSTLANWKRRDDFKAAVESIVETFREKAQSSGIAVLANRIAGYQDLWDRMLKIVTDRAADPTMEKVPGAGSGLLVRDFKFKKIGNEAKAVPIYRFDAALVSELRETAKQTAQELGQWMERHDLSGSLNVEQQQTRELMTVVLTDPAAHAAMGLLADKLAATSDAAAGPAPKSP